VLSALFVGLLCCFWPLRLLRYYAGFLILFASWIVLGLYSSCSTQLIRDGGTGVRTSRWWFALTLPVSMVIISLSGAAVTRASGFRSFAVPSTSMEPTILVGDRIVVDTRAYRLSLPQYRDVIVCYRDQTFFIKRVIGMGGDTIEGKQDNVIVNGNLINESYVQHARARSQVEWNDRIHSFGPVAVPAGTYFVMGDNRDVSLDSRSDTFGFIDRSSIIGKVLYVYGTAREGSRIR
jgi:signal peptidase I